MAPFIPFQQHSVYGCKLQLPFSDNPLLQSPTKIFQSFSPLHINTYQNVPALRGFVDTSWGLGFVGFFGKMLHILLIFPSQVTFSLSFPQKGSNSGT